MHGRVFLVLVLAQILNPTHPAFAQQLLTFDDTHITNQISVPISNGYGGLRWTNLAVFAQPSDLLRAAVSHPNFLRTATPGQALIYSGTPFDLHSAWVSTFGTGAFELRVIAMFGPVSLYTNSYSIQGNTTNFLNFGLQNITGVRILGASGTAPFSFDNISVTVPDRAISLPGWFKPGEIFFPIAEALAVNAGDLNHDGASELIISSRLGTTVAINTNGGFLRREITSTNNFQTIGNANFIATGDLTGDGHEDAVITTISQFGSQTTSRLIQFTNHLNFTFNPITNVFGPVAIGDFGGTNRIRVAQQSSWDIAAADFNLDGKLDYATISGNEFTQTLTISTNNGNGSFTTSVALPLAPATFALALNDFDGDNQIDIATVNQNSGAVAITYNSGLTTFTAPTNSPTGLVRPISLASADLDGDHIPDIAVRSAFSGLSILRGLGARRFAAPVIITEGAGYPSTNNFPRSIALRDLNSDGAPDIAFISGTEVVTLLNIFPPRLAINPIQDIVQIHWPTNFAKNALIEYTTDLGPNAIWTQDTFPQFQSGPARVIFDSGRSPQLYFRLRLPQ